MNKNLKKVISAAAALTISASSFAALAVDFPDVEATASYYQAVQELSALDVISGFEDGTFKPDELVTRAQITKMIVDALGKKKVAESAQNVATKFADVAAGEGGHWANGYISTGVASGFISGHSDTQFAPDDNVTFVQAQKMLVAALGYDALAQQNGGWPSGYTTYASQKGITKGVTALAEDQLTRAQVAQMIDNAMDVPLMVIDTYETNVFGTYPKYVEKNGTGKGYETLFTRLNAYKVYGRVTETAKTNQSLDTDKVVFQVEKADRFDDEEVYTKNGKPSRDADEMYFGNTKAESMVRTYAQALIQKNDDDEFTILSLVAAASNKSVDLLAADIDETKSSVKDGVLYFYPTGKTSGSTKYSLAKDVEFYLNGVKQDKSFSDEDLQKYIIDNDTTMITLQKTTGTGTTSTSSDYDVIMITAYGTAVVESVSDKSSSTVINFKSIGDGLKSKMTLQKDDENYRYSFTLNGEAIEATDLQEFDVLSISYDMDSFQDSRFYDVKVSRDVVENAKFRGSSSDGKTERFSTGDYKTSIDQEFESAVEYTLYLDINGRIAYNEEGINSKNLGIIKNAYTEQSGDQKVELFTKDGKVATFTVDKNDVFEAAKKIYDDAAANAANRPEQYALSVVEYKANSSTNKLTSIEAADDATGKVTNEYKESTSKMGSIRVAENTTIFDVSNTDKEKNDVKVMTALKDGVEYTAYGYSKSNSTSAYQFVVVTEGAGGIDSTSRLAIFLESYEGEQDEDGNEFDTIVVADQAGEEGAAQVTLKLDDNATYVDGSSVDVADFAEGDLLIYSLNGEGKVDEVLRVFAGPKDGQIKFTTDFFGSNSFASLLGKQSSDVLGDTKFNDILSDGEEEDVDVIFGAVVREKNSKGYQLADMDSNGIVDFSDALDLTITSNTKVYAYDYAANSRNHGRILLDEGMMVSAVDTNAYVDGNINQSKYDLSKLDPEDRVYAVARVFDGDEVQEIVLIVNQD